MVTFHRTGRTAAAVGLILLGVGVFRQASAKEARPADAADATQKVATDETDPQAAEAATERQMQPYVQSLKDSPVQFRMLPIPGGTYTIGSTDEERQTFETEYDLDPIEDETPRHEVKIAPFWMAETETTWDLYDTYRTNLDIKRRQVEGNDITDDDLVADAVSRPTAAYTDMTFNMGHDGYPAICMTQLAAKTFCEWLSVKTGHYYRLPTETEWEYACRGGTTTTFSWGDDFDAETLDEYAWYYDNADDQYQKVGEKKPNPWGLHDMHGNVAEWCLDGYKEDAYVLFKDMPADAMKVIPPFDLYPRVVRGGSWYDDPDLLRSAARMASDATWKIQDPQLPQSMWYHTDALFVGFRVIRPLEAPSEEEIQKYTLYPDVPPELVK